jgi:hypothetical protein
VTVSNALEPGLNQLGWDNVKSAEITVERAGLQRARVSYELDLRPLAHKLGRVALTIVLAIGLPVMLLVAGLMWFLVLPSAVVAVRWQVLQTCQVVHALWPPFLVTSRLRASARAAENLLRAVATAAGEGSDGR